MKSSTPQHPLITSMQELEQKLAEWSALSPEEKTVPGNIVQLVSLSSQLIKETLRQAADPQPAFIDANTPLPEDAREALKALADQQIPVICQAIEQKKLPTTYCHEIKSAFRALFDEDKLPVLSYRHQQYIPQLLHECLRLHSDKASSRWNDHLLETFVNYNFNYMGIFNRWRELRDAEFAEAAAKGEEEACYWKWEDTISHYNPKAGMAFDPSNQPLKVHMKRYLKLRKKQLRKKREHNPPEKSTQLYTKLLWGALAVRFHYFFPSDYDYENLPAAANDFIGVHAHKKGDKIKSRLFIKFDKEKLYKPARELYFLLGRIRKRMEQDFGFKNTDDD